MDSALWMLGGVVAFFVAVAIGQWVGAERARAFAALVLMAIVIALIWSARRIAWFASCFDRDIPDALF